MGIIAYIINGYTKTYLRLLRKLDVYLIHYHYIYVLNIKAFLHKPSSTVSVVNYKIKIVSCFFESKAILVKQTYFRLMSTT